MVTSYASSEDKDEDSEEVKSEVLFFTGAELHDLVRKHPHNLQSHYMEENNDTEEDPAEPDDEDGKDKAVKEESPAAKAMTWFKDVAKLAGVKTTFRPDPYLNKMAVCGEKFTLKAIHLASKAIADHMSLKGAESETLETDGTDLDTQKRSIIVLSINVQENHKTIQPNVAGKFKVIVREVCVRLKSDALETGTVLRDLPDLEKATATASRRWKKSILRRSANARSTPIPENLRIELETKLRNGAFKELNAIWQEDRVLSKLSINNMNVPLTSGELAKKMKAYMERNNTDPLSPGNPLR